MFEFFLDEKIDRQDIFFATIIISGKFFQFLFLFLVPRCIFEVKRNLKRKREREKIIYIFFS